MANPALHQAIHRLRASVSQGDGAELSDGELLEEFIARRDETAFETLVRRHGPMVYGVCRRILGNAADADDAFQATFLVLVRKASSVRPRGMVSNWLYGVAHNTAIKAKAMIQQRRVKENEAGTMPRADKSEEAWQQMQSSVDLELSLLPDKYRVPIVLCDLEGKTIKEATHHLGWPQGTVASRLTRGRALLARRLSKRGLAVTAGALAGALSQGAASASVPGTLAATTVQAGCLYAAGKTAAACGASAAVLALTDGVLKTMLLVKLKLAAAVVAVAAVITAGVGGYVYHQTPGPSPTSTPAVMLRDADPPAEAKASAPASSQSGISMQHEPKPPAKTQTKIYIVQRQHADLPPAIFDSGVKRRPGGQVAISIRLTRTADAPGGSWMIVPAGQSCKDLVVKNLRLLQPGSADISAGKVKVFLLTFVKDKSANSTPGRIAVKGPPGTTIWSIHDGGVTTGSIVEIRDANEGMPVYRLDKGQGEG